MENKIGEECKFYSSFFVFQKRSIRQQKTDFIGIESQGLLSFLKILFRAHVCMSECIDETFNHSKTNRGGM